MSVRVEFYGIPRSRAGVQATELDVGAGASFSQILAELAARFPNLAGDCICQTMPPRGAASLRQGYTASLGGQRFVNDPDEVLRPGDSLLIMSADAGG